ncbi:MAG: protein tyrosine phosphatase [Halobacteriovoraceae bacterium]|nr:protein tyrosine phosphatase [Halobacteriovoraceae bacterium]
MNKVLFVCLGNICRSPAGEAVLKSLTSGSDYLIDSAGTNGFHDGEKADHRMREAASRRGIDITSISRQIKAADLEEFDYILTMDNSNYANTVKLNPKYESKVHKFCQYLDSNFSDYNEVPDPYFGGDAGFELVLDLLENGCRNFLKQVK